MLPLVCFLFVCPATAHAHTPIEGIGDFLAGLVHPLITPSHILILLALGLLLGQQSPLKLKWPMLVFVTGSAVALMVTTTGVIAGPYQPLLLAIALCAATLVALEKSLPPVAAHALFAIAAVAVGLDSRVESTAASTVTKTLAGTWISLMVLLADIAIYVSLCTKKHWTKVGIRIAGSWIIAITLLVLAFSFRK
jgi:hydrogenase/urease accessory protein HupE